MAIQEMLDFTAKLNIILNGDEKFQKASSSLQNLQENTKKLAEIQSKFAQSNSLDPVIANLQRTQDAHKATRDVVKSSLTQAKQKHTELTNAYQSENAKLTALKSSAGKNSKEYKTQNAVVKKLAAELKATGREINSLEKQESSLANQIDAANEKIQARKNQLANDYTNALHQAGISEKEFISRQDQIARALSRSQEAQAKFESVKKNLSWSNIEQSVIHPAMAAYSSIQPFVKISADFEAQMARVKAVAFAGGTEKELNDWRELVEQAAQLGADTQFSAIQAGQAMENLARAGMSKDAIKNTMPALLDMAAAEGMSIDQAAGILANVQSGMGMSSSDSKKIADILAYTSGASNLSIAGLGEALSKVASTAKGQNVSLEQISAYIGTLANKGFGMEIAGTGLMNIFRRIANTENSLKLSELGVRTQTKSGEMVEIPEIMRQLNASLGSKGPKEQLAKLSEIFGAQAGIVQALMQASQAGELQQLESDIKNNYSGRASAMANINLDTLQGQITLLSSAWDGFKTNIGDTFNPIIRAGVEALTSALSKISALMKEFPTLSKGLTLAFGAFTSGKLIFGVANLARNLFALPGAFFGVVNAGREVAGTLSSIGASVPKIGGAFSALVNPAASAFNLVKTVATGSLSVIMAHPFIAGGAALVAGVVLLAKNWDKVKGALSSAADFAKNEWNVFYDWCSDAAKEFSDWWGSWTFPDIWAGLKNSFFETLGQIKTMWTDIGNWFASLNPFKGAGKTLKSEVVSAANTAGKKSGSTDYHIAAMNSAFAPHGLATGGILTRPTIAQVAEDGPEAIIPLTDKTRGVPLLMQAAQSLGVSRDNISLENFAGISSGKGAFQNVVPVDVHSRNDDGRDFGNSYTRNAQAVINISVSGSKVDDENSLAEKISRAVRQAWYDMQEQQARISFA